MNPPTAEQVREIIESGDFSRFINLTESIDFEVKRSLPYDLSLSSGQFELAKDVSALANSDGGYIIVGCKDEPVPGAQTGQVKELDLLPQEAFFKSKIEGFVKSYLHPKIKGLKVEWKPSKDDSTIGIGVIYVPPQDARAKLFIIKKVIDDSELQKAVIVGIARRVGASSMSFTPEELYGLIRQGSDPGTERLARIEGKVDLLVAKDGADLSQSKGVLKTLHTRTEDIIPQA